VPKYQHKEKKMNYKLQTSLSKRERQIMEVIYRRKSASVKEVLGDIPNPPTYSAVRSILNILEEKGFLKHKKQGKKYVYSPTIPAGKATKSAVKQLLSVYFNNSLEKAVTTMLEMHNDGLTDADYKRLSQIIERARKENDG
jgi:predicted transcriptional regulator